jgi:hypothetical protein
VVAGYAVAALAHSLFDWGLVRPLLEYFRDQNIRPETLMEALPIAIPCVLGVVIAALILFVRQLKLCGREDARAADPRHLALRRYWRIGGNVVVIVGAIGLVGSVIVAVVASMGLQGQPQPTDLSQVSPEELQASIRLTIILVSSPMLILFGILVRQKQ